MNNAGKYRWVATIESPPVEQLPTGEPDQDRWVDEGSRRCSVECTGGGTKVADGTEQQQAVTWYKVEMRLNLELLPSYRLTISGRPHSGVTMYVHSISHTITETMATCVTRGND